MATTPQELKRYGYLPDVGLSNLADNRAMQLAGQVNSAVLLRQCGCPDAVDDEIADLAEDEVGDHSRVLGAALAMDPDEAFYLSKAHATLRQSQAATTGSGSWPAGCHKDINPDRHVVTYYVDYESFPSHYKYALKEDELNSLVVNSRVWPWTLEQLKDEWLGKPMLDLAFRLLEESYRRIGVKQVRMPSKSGHDILVKSRVISGSTIGIGWFPNGRCDDVTEYHIDSSWKPDLDNCSLLLNHENGHCHGFVHQFTNQGSHKSVMSYNWPNHTYGFLTGSEGILPRDASWGQINKFFGTEPYPSDDVPPPPDPGYNGVVVLDGRPRKIKVLPAGQMEGVNGVFTHKGELLGFKLLEN